MTLPELWSHQREAIRPNRKKFALFFDPGTGKTRTALELYKANRSRTFGFVVVVAPLTVCRNWELELSEYLGEPFHVTIVAGGTNAKKQAAMKRFKEFSCLAQGGATLNAHQFLIMNIETFRTPDFLQILIQMKVDCLIIDESHNFRSPDSRQTKGLIACVGRLRPRLLYLLTGSPAPQGPTDLWSTFVLMGRTQDVFYVWRLKNFEDVNEQRKSTKGYFQRFEVKPDALRSFQRTLGEISLTARKDDVLDLPPLLHTTHYAPMGKEQGHNYETMLEWFFAVDKETGEELNATNVLARSLRLQQILCGWLGEIEIKDNRRIEALEGVLDSIGPHKKFIVWTNFRATYQQISRCLEDRGVKHNFIIGGQTSEERAAIIADFQSDDGHARALIANPKAGGIGINLTAASDAVLYNLSYSLEKYLQLEARNYRGGSERHERITQHHICTEGTIDEDILASLRSKEDVQDFLLRLKKKYRRTE